jgi:hypothetical protein
MRADLARGQRANACRKLGPAAKPATQWRPRIPSPRASHGMESADSSVEDASGSESGDIGLSSVERALGSVRCRAHSWARIRRRDRERQESGSPLPARPNTPSSKEGRRFRATVRNATGEHELQLARAVPNAAPLGSEMPSWLSDTLADGGTNPRWKSSQRKGRPWKRRFARSDLRARERGFPRVLVTTDRLQRLVRGIFSSMGRQRFVREQHNKE